MQPRHFYEHYLLNPLIRYHPRDSSYHYVGACVGKGRTCKAAIDKFADHPVSCTKSGLIKLRATPLGKTLALILREAGARVQDRYPLNKAGIPTIPPTDKRHIEIVVTGLPLHQGKPIAIDVTLISPLKTNGQPHPNATRKAGSTFAAVEKRKKQRQYPELTNDGPLRLAVAAIETGGRMNNELKSIIDAAATLRARQEADRNQLATHTLFRNRWTTMLSIATQNALAATILDEGTTLLDAPDKHMEPLTELLTSHRHASTDQQNNVTHFDPPPQHTNNSDGTDDDYLAGYSDNDNDNDDENVNEFGFSNTTPRTRNTTVVLTRQLNRFDYDSECDDFDETTPQRPTPMTLPPHTIPPPPLPPLPPPPPKPPAPPPAPRPSPQLQIPNFSNTHNAADVNAAATASHPTSNARADDFANSTTTNASADSRTDDATCQHSTLSVSLGIPPSGGANQCTIFFSDRDAAAAIADDATLGQQSTLSVSLGIPPSSGAIPRLESRHGRQGTADCSNRRPPTPQQQPTPADATSSSSPPTADDAASSSATLGQYSTLSVSLGIPPSSGANPCLQSRHGSPGAADSSNKRPPHADDSSRTDATRRRLNRPTLGTAAADDAPQPPTPTTPPNAPGPTATRTTPTTPPPHATAPTPPTAAAALSAPTPPSSFSLLLFSPPTSLFSAVRLGTTVF